MGKPFLLRNSERTAWRRCRWRWDLTYNRNLVPIREAPPLRFGSLVHSALEHWYIPGTKRGVHPAKTFTKLYDEQIELGAVPFGSYTEEEEWIDARELGIAMMEGYVDEYGLEKHIKVIAPEMTFQVPVLHPKTGKVQHISVGTMDAACYDLSLGKFFLMEDKTAKTISTNHLSLDEQAGTYHAFAAEVLRRTGHMKEDEDIDFILYNFLRKALPDSRPRNDKGQYLNKPKKDALVAEAEMLGLELPKSATIPTLTTALEAEGVDVELLGEPSKNQPSPLFAREKVYRESAARENVMWRITAQAWEIKQARAGKLPIYKNPTRDCSWDCALFDVCELHEAGADWEAAIDMEFTTWDPYGEHLSDHDIPKEL